MLFGAYRKDDYADPVSFIAQLGIVLEDYPIDVVETVTGPQFGIQRKKRFPPSIEEVVDACEYWMGIKGGPPGRAELREMTIKHRRSRP